MITGEMRSSVCLLWPLRSVYAHGQFCKPQLATDNTQLLLQLKIVSSRAINFQQSSTFFFAFVPTPLKDHFLCFCSRKMPPEIMSACSKQLRLMLPYFSDKTGKGAAFLSQKKNAVEMLSILLLLFFLRGGCCESVMHSWHYKAEPFRHQI